MPCSSEEGISQTSLKYKTVGLGGGAPSGMHTLLLLLEMTCIQAPWFPPVGWWNSALSSSLSLSPPPKKKEGRKREKEKKEKKR